MNKLSKINYWYILLAIPGELIIDFLSYFQDLHTFDLGIHPLIPIYLFIFGTWQLFIGPLFDKFGIKRILGFHILIYFLGCACGCFSSAGIKHLGKILEIISGSAAQVAYYCYLCRLSGELKYKILIIHKGLIGIILLFIPLLSYFSLDLNLLIQFNIIYIIASILYLKHTVQDNHDIAIEIIPTNQTLSEIYRLYFRTLLSKDFIYYATCVVLSQLLVFAFYSHPFFYFELDDPFYDIDKICIFAGLDVILIFYLLKKYAVSSLYKTNIMYAVLLGICALMLILNHNENSSINNNVIYVLLCGSLLFGISNMGEILSQGEMQSSVNVTLVGFVEALSGGVASLLYFSDLKMNLQQYSLYLYLSGLFIALFTFFFKYSISHQ